jgi:hypothetical protein
MKTVVITYKGVVIKEPNQPFGKRAAAGDVVTVSDGDATLLIGMGRAKPCEPPKEPPNEPTKMESEKELAKELKKEGSSAPPRPERKKE